MTAKRETDDVTFYDLFVPLTTKKVIIFLIIIGFCVFFNALFGRFVWDDLPFIIINPELHSVDIARAFGDNVYNSNGYYRPLQPLYFSVLFALFRDSPFLYHLIQISLHILSAILLYFLFNKFFTISLAFFLSVVFLVHPMQVESVSYIAASGFQLFFIFGIWAVLLSLKETLKKRYIVLTGILLLASILTRETGLMFFIVILVLQLIYYKKRIVPVFLIELFTIVLYAFIRFGISGSSFIKDNIYPIAQLSFWERMVNIPQIIFYYLKTLFYPAKLAINQHWIITTFSWQEFYIPLLIDVVYFLVYAFVGYRMYVRNKAMFKVFLFFSIWSFIGFGMLLQIIPLDMTVAERWVYFPIVGVLGVAATIYQSLNVKGKTVNTIILYLTVTLVALFSIRTIIRNTNWNTPYTLYAHDIQVESNYDLENMLGTELASQKRYKEALVHLLNANKQRFQDSNLYNIGLVYEALGDTEQAKNYFQQVVEERKMLVRAEVRYSAHIALARVLLISEDIESSRDFFANATKLYPEEATFWSYLAINEYKLNNKNAALKAAEKAKKLLPNNSTSMLYNRIKNDQPLNLKMN